MWIKVVQIQDNSSGVIVHLPGVEIWPFKSGIVVGPEFVIRDSSDRISSCSGSAGNGEGVPPLR
jgi:hypothetical protein